MGVLADLEQRACMTQRFQESPPQQTRAKDRVREQLVTRSLPGFITFGFSGLSLCQHFEQRQYMIRLILPGRLGDGQRRLTMTIPFQKRIESFEERLPRLGILQSRLQCTRLLSMEQILQVGVP